ncbi:MAG: formate dehydrogenase accessory sulfurtransferase FdhD [Coriobacteriales bacterium]|nr:formate dehydrogenase accessory sulfurtransferase FdhD [Coriobacteriales bacterium]
MTPTDAKLPITAAVLAGGRSMRMGVDKTLLDIDGRPLVLRVLDAVRDVCESAYVVTNRPEAVAEIGVPAGVDVLVDEVAYQGPLGGLVTAMKSATTEWVLAVAADMPHLEPGVVRALWSVHEGVDVVVPMTDKGPEPLLALYRVEACLPAARKVLATGRRRLVAIFAQVRVAEVPADALRSVDPDLYSLVNVNTPADLAEARDVAAGTQPHGEPVRVFSEPPRAMPSERPVTLYMNDVEVATVQATPSNLEEMGVGFLLSEGLISDRDALQGVDVDAKRGLVYVTTTESVPDDMVYRTRYVTSGCGKGVTFSSLGHARDLAPVTTELEVGSDELYSLVGAMARSASAYRDTGGMHACGLALEGELMYVREDVGRHNALDKVLGRAWLDSRPTSSAILLSTGRISYEMAVKAAKARVPVVVSRSAVTDLAAEIAGELGITLVGYARGGRMTVYTHPERVRLEEPVDA